MQTFTGREYLKIDIASNFGLDKKTWQERIDWFDANENILEAHEPQADSPALYFAGVQAWRQVQKGEAIGYPISLDATSSGLQILACLTGDRRAAQLCNVVNIGYRADAYTAVYQEMVGIVGSEAKIKREDTKQAIMTAFYGSTAMPKKVFGEGEMLSVFEHVMEENAPAPWELNKAFLAIWDDTALSNDWVLPDNFHVKVKVMDTHGEMVNFLNEPFEITYKVNAPIAEGRSLSANTIHSIDGMIVREMTRRCGYDSKKVERLRYFIESYQSLGVYDTLTPDDIMVNTLWSHYKKSGFLSARIIDHLTLDNLGNVDADVILALLDTLPKKPFNVISIHDCFRCLPNYGNDLRQQYALLLHLIAKSDLLSFILSQIMHKEVNIGKLDETLADDVLDAEYALS